MRKFKSIFLAGILSATVVASGLVGLNHSTPIQIKSQAIFITKITSHTPTQLIDVPSNSWTWTFAHGSTKLVTTSIWYYVQNLFDDNCAIASGVTIYLNHIHDNIKYYNLVVNYTYYAFYHNSLNHVANINDITFMGVTNQFSDGLVAITNNISNKTLWNNMIWTNTLNNYAEYFN